MQENRHGEAVESVPHARPKASGGTTTDRVLHKQTSVTPMKGHQIRASREEPQYIVTSDNGGKASYEPSALTKI
ncbi:DUF2945 domain-containing protein [Sphingomonas suaedae]|uniref:DUF2945 domain-containing protein n=2 Tax=Sphingomonas suaedae TaxID=2599297 RepID=A0A518RAW7_9SPHN|nr:DUF2945 domain-containing protein [Sphingomonas suaedae]QDX24588.1 DUF2945 domain-containing protein [Sphingomonas suaedae]